MATLDGTESDRDTEASELTDWLSSSSFALSKAEISTMGGMAICWWDEYEGKVVAQDQWLVPYTWDQKRSKRFGLAVCQAEQGH